MDGADYRYDPDAYEIEEASRPDEMSMIEAVRAQARSFLDTRGAANVLDLCCGTGLSLVGVADHANATEVVGVDNCEPYLAFARTRFSGRPVRFANADAVEPPVPEGYWDLIILCSAYHHIEDARKTTFLERVAALLRPGGRAVMGENVLPPYQESDHDSYAEAVRAFYEEVLATALAANSDLSQNVRELIQRVAKYGYDGEYEYKTSMEVLVRYIERSPLRLVAVEKLWPANGPLCMTSGGNYVIQLEHR